MNIVGIGGGNKNAAIQYALELSGDQRPNVLLVPSACSTEFSYKKKVPQLTEYFKELGVDVTTLHNFEEDPSETKIAHELGRASMFYTIGGNSPHMIRTMQKHGTDIAISDAIREGKVHAGTSAGALLPFELAHSNIAKRPAEENWDYTFLPMLSLLKGVATAHANQHDMTPNGVRTDTRMDHLIANFPNDSHQGIAIENGVAVVISSQGNDVIKSNQTSNAYIIKREHNQTFARAVSDPNDLALFH